MLQNVKPKIILITIALCTGLLFSGYYAYNVLLVDNPLVNRIEAYEEVKSVVLAKDSQTLQITLNNKSSLPLLYERLSNEIKNTSYKLEISHEPSAKLIDFYYRSQFIIQEALVKGNYEEMRQLIEQMGYKNGIDTRLYIDHDNIYVYLIDEAETKDYFAVIPRQYAREVK